jgi:hypothetical protein
VSSQQCNDCIGPEHRSITTVSSEFVLRPPVVLILLASYQGRTNIPDAWNYPTRIQIPLSSSHYSLMGNIYHANAHYFATAYVPEQAIFLYHNDCEANGAVHSFTDTRQADLIEANNATVAAVYYLDGGTRAQQSIVEFRARYLECFRQASINQANSSEGHPINRDESASGSTALLSSARRGFFTYRVTDPRLFESHVVQAASMARHEQSFVTALNPLPTAISTVSGPITHPLGSLTNPLPSTIHSDNPLIPLDSPSRSPSPVSPGNLAQALMTIQPSPIQPIASENSSTQLLDESFVCICGLNGNLSDLFADKRISRRMHLPKCLKCHRRSHGRCATDKTYPRVPEAFRNSRWVCDLCLQDSRGMAEYEMEMEEAHARAEDALFERQRARHQEDLESAQKLLKEAQQHPLCELRLCLAFICIVRII